MKKMLDYTFYRIARFYYKWDRSYAVTAITLISVYESLLLVVFYFFTISTLTKQSYSTFTYKLIFGPIMVAIMIANTIYFKNKYPKLNKLWRNESRNDRIKHGFYIFLAVIFLLTYSIVLFKVRQKILHPK